MIPDAKFTVENGDPNTCCTSDDTDCCCFYKKDAKKHYRLRYQSWWGTQYYNTKQNINENCGPYLDGVIYGWNTHDSKISIYCKKPTFQENGWVSPVGTDYGFKC